MATSRSKKTTVQFQDVKRVPLPKLKPATEWEKLGVPVQRDPGDFPRQERETTLAFINSETEAEVNTCEPMWMRRLEADGARPQSIQVFEQSDGEFRFYTVPKSWIRRPQKPRRRT